MTERYQKNNSDQPYLIIARAQSDVTTIRYQFPLEMTILFPAFQLMEIVVNISTDDVPVKLKINYNVFHRNMNIPVDVLSFSMYDVCGKRNISDRQK